MRTQIPELVPLFRSEMQLRLLSLLLLQPEREWTLSELSNALSAPHSSVHREIGRAEAAGILERDAAARPHRFRAATESPLYEPLAAILQRSVGIEDELQRVLTRPGVQAAVVHGSWASGPRRADSDIDVMVIGDADLRELRRLVRPIGKSAGRTVDLTVMTAEEFRDLVTRRASFSQRLLDGPTTPLVGDLRSIASQ